MPIPDSVLRRLEWRTTRPLDGRIQGARRAAARGSGLDLAELRPYREGEDARRIDWNATARIGEPYARVFHEDRAVTAWIVADVSPSVRGAGRALLIELAVAIARLLARGGDPVGAVLADGSRVRVLPPARGTLALRRLDDALAEAPRDAKVTAAGRRRARRRRVAGAQTDLEGMMDAASAAIGRRSVVVVLTDLLGTGDWPAALARLSTRAETTVVRVVDRTERELPAVGALLVEDAETGEQLLVDGADPGFRAGLHEAHVQHDAEVLAAGRRAAVAVHTVGSDTDPVRALVQLAASTAPRRGGGLRG